MSDTPVTYSPSGVRIATDFRDNLIIDRYDPVFMSMRAGKVRHLQSENSEDAVTWNVFRSLRQLQPQSWLPTLLRIGVPNVVAGPSEAVVLNLWSSISPPLGLVGSEGDSEIDVIIESPDWVWVIEAKYRSDISTRTTVRPLRDQVLRNIDVGSYYAGQRRFFFSLLVRDEETSPLGAKAVRKYANLSTARLELAGHRPDGLANLEAVTLLTWADVAAVLQEGRDSVRREDERGYAERALAWMEGKGLLGDVG